MPLNGVKNAIYYRDRGEKLNVPGVSIMEVIDAEWE
jgi:hypothetical protein